MMGSITTTRMVYRHMPGKVPLSYSGSLLPMFKTGLPRLSTLSLTRYSSVRPKTSQNETPQQQQQQSSSSADPFGIEEVIASDESTLLVQGFYEEKGSTDNKTTVSPPPSPSPPRPAPPPQPLQQENSDPMKEKRLKQYGSWLKQRKWQFYSGKSEVGVAESLRTSNYGTVRVDSDNPIESHGQYDTQDYKLRGDAHQNFRNDRESLRNRLRGKSSSEPIIETIEADHSKIMRASDFLEQKLEQQRYTRKDDDSDDSQDPERKKMVIEKVILPKRAPSMDPERVYELAKEDPLLLDSHTIPKEYLLPDYNAITELDTWNILKKSVIFQNEFVLAINKPPGIPVHSKTRDCRHVIIQFLKKFAEFAECKKVYPLHRLDSEATGVLLFAKNNKVADIIKQKFADRQILKKYLAVTKLCPRVPEGTIKIPIGEGKIPGTEKYRCVLRPDLREYGISPSSRHCFEGVTNFKVLNSIKEASFLEIEPVTGYKHQIRVHLGMGLGCPVIGDHKYSHRDKLAPQRLHPFLLHKIKVRQSKVRELPLHLHCNSVSFTLPEELTKSTEPVYIHAKIPMYMRYTLRRLNLIK